MRRLMLFVLGLAASLVLLPTTAVADSATHTYLLEMDAPNIGHAPQPARRSVGNPDRDLRDWYPRAGCRPRAENGGRDAQPPGHHQLQSEHRRRERLHTDELADALYMLARSERPGEPTKGIEAGGRSGL